MNAPEALVEAANRYENEQRSIEYVLLDRAQAGDDCTASPEVLAKFFEERKILSARPNIANSRLVSLIPAEQARWIEISDADLNRAYEERRSALCHAGTSPRRADRISPTCRGGQRGCRARRQGHQLFGHCQGAGQERKDIDLGTVTKAGMIDRAAADAAFALKEGEVSAPVQGRFGTVLVQVLKIEPEQVRSLEQVAGELKQELAIARAKAEVFDVYNKIEDARAEGKPLAERPPT